MPNTELESVIVWFRESFLKRHRELVGENHTEELIKSFKALKDGDGELAVSALCDEGGWLKGGVHWPTYFSRLCKKLPQIGPYDEQGSMLEIKHVHGSNRFEFRLSRAVVPLSVKVDPMYDELQRLVKARPSTRQAVFIQHSGMTTLSLRRLLLQSGASVDLYVQHPDAACNKAQRGKVAYVAGDMRNIHKDDVEGSKASLRVFYYMAPASIRAVLIDDELLAVGWYTYHQERAVITREDGINVQGDNRPLVIVSKGRPEFDPLVQMFNRVLADMKTYAVPVEPPPVEEPRRPPSKEAKRVKVRKKNL